MATSIFRAGNTAVITGGASGIGYALATKCKGYGMKVLVADRNEKDLAHASKLFSTVQMDVSKLDDWAKLKSKVDADLDGHIDLLALNAGLGLDSSWTDTAAFATTINTNLFGVLHGIATFLPTLQSTATPSRPTAIIITGSKQGITNPPGSRPAYNASKAAVKTIAEHLSFDMRRDSPSVGVHLLVPGWTWTGLMGSHPEEETEMPKGAWRPEQVVEYLEGKMGEGKFYVVCPDGDVTEELDRARMKWSAEDVAEGRPALSRWSEEWKERHAEFVAKEMSG